MAGRATSIAYPLGDILLMATLARLLITSGSNRAAALLGAGVAGLLASDVVYGLGQLDGTWAIGSYYDLGWVVFYIAWGLAALHPSMAELTVPMRPPSAEMGLGRIALLMAVSLVAPAALLVESLTGDARSATMIAGSSALLFLIVLVRLSGVVARHRQAVERERTLRAAGADLVSAGDAADLATSVRRAVGRLVPPGATHRPVLLVDGATAGVPGPGADVPEEPSRLLHVADLDGVAAREMDGFATALVCPLVPTDRPIAGASMGLLVVAAASMHFVAESVTEDPDEFDEFCAAFVATVRPGGHLVAAFMENMGRYELGDGSRWPGIPVDGATVARVVGPLTEDLRISRIDADPGLPAYGYTGMVLMRARRLTG